MSLHLFAVILQRVVRARDMAHFANCYTTAAPSWNSQLVSSTVFVGIGAVILSSAALSVSSPCPPDGCGAVLVPPS